MVVLVALVVLGPKRLPGLARTIGSTLRSLRRASADLRHAVEEPLREVQQPLEEMRQELYETVHHFEGEVARSLRDDEGDGDGEPDSDEAEALSSPPGSESSLAAGEEHEELPALAGTEPLEEVDDYASSPGDDSSLADDDSVAEEDAYGRVASTDPFGADPYADLHADEGDASGGDPDADGFAAEDDSGKRAASERADATADGGAVKA